MRVLLPESSSDDLSVPSLFMSSATVPLQTLLEYASKQGLDILSSHFAEYMDMIDPLASVREEFSIPTALSLRKSLLRSNPELVYNKEAHLPGK